MFHGLLAIDSTCDIGLPSRKSYATDCDNEWHKTDQANTADRPPLASRRFTPLGVEPPPVSAVLGKTRGGLNAENRIGARPSIPDATTERRQDNAAFVVSREPRLVGSAYAVG
jgi:hypothetical protein